MSLAELLTKINEVQPLADEKVETGAIETLNARRGRQRRASEELVTLRQEYTNELRRTAAYIVVIGDKSNEFSTIAVNAYKCFSADPEEYFKDLISRISSHLYLGRETVSNLFDVLGRHIEERAESLGIVGYSQLIFKQEYQRAIRNQEDFLGVVKQAVTDQIGGEIVGIQAAYSLTKSAIERKNKSNRTPIVLATTDEAFGIKVANDLTRISHRVFFVTAGEVKTTLKNTDNILSVPEVTKEAVNKTLNTITNILKKEELAQKQ